MHKELKYKSEMGSIFGCILIVQLVCFSISNLSFLFFICKYEKFSVSLYFYFTLNAKENFSGTFNFHA